MEKQIIDQGLERLGINIEYNPEEFQEFQELLLKYNEITDLTGITDPEEIALKHYLDSMTIFMVEEFNGPGKMLDLGTGAGFPAIPIRLVNQDLDITLLDSLNKRLKFLDLVIDEMNLKNIRTLHGRGEDLANDKDYRESYDLVVSRAVARLNILVELALPLVKIGGLMVAMKGRDGKGEYQEAANGIKELGGNLREIKEFYLSEDQDDMRSLIVIEKVKASPKKYPRNYGQIKKKPL